MSSGSVKDSRIFILKVTGFIRGNSFIGDLMKNYIDLFFSELIYGHQLSLEQVSGCHKGI